MKNTSFPDLQMRNKFFSSSILKDNMPYLWGSTSVEMIYGIHEVDDETDIMFQVIAKIEMHFPVFWFQRKSLKALLDIGSWLLEYCALLNRILDFLFLSVYSNMYGILEYCALLKNIGHRSPVSIRRAAVMYGMLGNELGKVIIAEFGSRYFD